jgi:hypothetical protein
MGYLWLIVMVVNNHNKYLWDIYGISNLDMVKYGIGDIYGISMEYLLNIYGISMGYLWSSGGK